MTRAIMMVAVLGFLLPGTSFQGHAEQAPEVFSGIIEQLNTAEGKVTVKNEIGR